MRVVVSEFARPFWIEEPRRCIDVGVKLASLYPCALRRE
jgi:hypothetical protein